MSSETLRIPGTTRELARVRRTVARWAAEAGLSARATRQAQTAVDEALANVIEHGVPGIGAGTGAARSRITVRGETAPGTLAVTIRHRGSRFDPTATPVSLAAARDGRAVHGYGLHLLQRLADDLAYRHDGGTNEIRIVKRS